MNRNNQIIKESMTSLYKMVLGFIPGGHVAQELLELRSRINKQKISRFSELMHEAFEKQSELLFDSENLKTEDFLFAFEAVIRKVVNTKSEDKLRRYANILLRQYMKRMIMSYS